MGAMRTIPDEGACLDQIQLANSQRVACKSPSASEDNKWPDFEVEGQLQGQQVAVIERLREQLPIAEWQRDRTRVRAEPADDMESFRDTMPNDEKQRQQEQLSSSNQLPNYDGQHPRLGHFQAPIRAHTANFKQLPHQAPTTRPTTTPKTYPNNTLVEDLSKCHNNLWPKAARATSKTIELIKFCLPAAAASKRQFQAGNKSATTTMTTTKSPNEDAFPVGLERQEIAGGPQDQVDCDAAQKRRPSLKAQQLKRTKSQVASGRPTKTKRSYKFPIPESILRLNSTLTQDDYNRALCMLTSDIRFQLHLFLYRRLQTVWLLFTTILCILLPLLLVASVEPLAIVCSCSLWLLLQALGFVVGGRCRKKLDRMLERSIAQVNSYFMDHNLMLGVINIGGLLTRSRLIVPVLYFDTFQCIEQIESIVSSDLEAGGDLGAADKERRRTSTLDYSKIGLRQMEPNQRAFAQSQLAKKIVLRYSQRWISHFDRRKLMFTDDRIGPRHLSTGKCLCQFIEEHFRAGGDQEPLEDLNDEQQQQQQPQTDEAHASPRIRAEQEQHSRQLEAALTRTIRGEPYDVDKTIIDMPTAGEYLDQASRGGCDELGANKARSITPLTSGIGNGDHCDMFVPTLSHLVSLKERNQELARGAAVSDSLDLSSQSYSSKLIEGFASHLQQERLDASSSPTTELSLELDSELLQSRNDELFKKLKALLELRSSEFSKGLDGGLASTGTSHTNHQQTTTASNSYSNSNSNNNCSSPSRTIICDNQDEQVGGPRGGSILSNGQTNQQSDANNNHGSPMSQIGKKFFTQADGLFFLNAKKSQQQGVYAKQQQQMLKIC